MAKQGVAAAAGWTTLGGVINQILQFGISVALARLLAPADFGLLAMVAALTGFARVLADFGISSALIQAKAPTAEEYSALFWLNILVSVVLGVAVAVAAPAIADFYGEPRVKAITLLLAPQFLLTSLGSVHSARLQKRLAFAQIIKVELVTAALGGVAAILAAKAGWGPWSLILRTYVQALSFVGGAYVLEPWLPALRPNLGLVKRYLHFSLHLTGSRALNYWTRNIDNVLIAKYFGPLDVALYVRGYSTLLQPLAFLTTALSRVMFPAMSAVQDDKARARDLYKKALRAIAFTVFPLMAVLFVVSSEFLLVVFGQKWMGTLNVLRIFCVLGALQAVGATAGWVFQSQGRADLQMWWNFGAGAILIASIFLGIRFGSIDAVALSYAICSGVILLYPALELPGRLIGMGFWAVAKELWGTTLCTLVAAGAAYGARHVLMGTPAVVRLVAVSAVGMLIYIAVARAVRLVAMGEMLALVGRLRKRRAAPAPG